MTKTLKLFVPLALLIILSLGCSLSGGDKTPPTAAPANGEATEPTAAAAEPTDAAAKPGDGEEEGSLSSITEGLQNLDSYRSHLKMTFQSDTEGETEQQVIEMDIEYVHDPLAQHIVLQGGDSEGTFEVFHIGDQQYLFMGEGQCMSSSSDEDMMDTELFDPDDIMGGLDNLHRVQPDETINGVPCHHYNFDQTSMLGENFASAQGDVWIAVDGGYVVKYVMQAEGTDPETQQVGHIAWEYQLRDVNTPITIELPEACAGAGAESEFPIMADATNMTTMTGMTMYESASSFDDVVAFYQEQMPANGWSDTGGGFSSPGNTMLNYGKEGRTANIIISESDGTVSVMITNE